MVLNIRCPKCGGRMFEDEPFLDDGEKIQELTCIVCAKSVFLNYNKYKKKIEEIAGQRSRATTRT